MWRRSAARITKMERSRRRDCAGKGMLASSPDLISQFAATGSKCERKCSTTAQPTKENSSCHLEPPDPGSLINDLNMIAISDGEAGERVSSRGLPTAIGTSCNGQIPDRPNYGVISLFDGVSSVVPALCSKLGYPPKVVVLAETDDKLRGLVCAEFGYRNDEKWGRNFKGTACIYLRDVKSVIANRAKVLVEAVKLAPGVKWFIVGGSPCPDLTFAGPHRGLLGILGPCSHLFLCLQRTISVMEDLADGRNISATSLKMLVPWWTCTFMLFANC